MDDKHLLASVLRCISSGLIVTGKNNTITILNDMASQLTGWSQEEVAGKPFHEVIPITAVAKGKESDQYVEESVLTQLANTRKETVYFFTKKDGTKFPAAVSNTSVILDGEIVGTAYVFDDITALIQADKAKSDFIAITSHQLRTPLGSMRWNLEMLINGDYGDLPQEAKIALEQVFENDIRMLEMVNNLLDVSRIDQGRVPNLPAPTNLSEAVEHTTKELDLTAKNKGVSLIFENKFNGPAVNIDPKRFRDVVENLVSNAVKYTAENGKVVVTVSGDDKEFQMAVADNGMGIPQDEQSRLFHRFFRAANAIKSQADGSGLGLYIVKSYVETWGGKIWFESEVGKGTTFYFKIPVVQ